MHLTSVAFLGGFLPATVILYYAVNNRTWRNLIVLLASLSFFALGSPSYAVVILTLALLNFIVGLLIERLRRPVATVILWIITILNFGAIILFGHISSLGQLYNISLAMPLGLTIFVLQAHRYLLEVYRKSATAERNYFHLLLCVSFFPQMAVGPIVPYSEMASQVRERKESTVAVLEGFFCFAMGLIKLAVLASYAGAAASSLLKDNLISLSASGAWVGIFLFACQVFFVYSGFSDMATGLALVFGFRFKDNYRHPYMARSISDFWSRWNTSLIRYFNEVVTLPERTQGYGDSIKIFIIWSLVGLWHGLQWHLLLWGLVSALLVAVDKKLASINADTSRIHFVGNVVTLLMILFSWGVFYYSSPRDLGRFLVALLGLMNRPIALTPSEALAIHRIFWLLPVFVIACTPLPMALYEYSVKKLKAIARIMQAACAVGLLAIATGLWVASLASAGLTSPSDRFTFPITAFKHANIILTSHLERVEELVRNERFLRWVEERAAREADIAAAEPNATEHKEENLPGVPIITLEISDPATNTDHEEEPYVVAGEYLVFADRAIQLFTYNPAVIVSAQKTINEVMASLPSSIRKYVLLAPMQICFEKDEYKAYSDNLVSAIEELYLKLLPEVVPIDAYKYMRRHSEDKLYLHTDSYWTARGAYYAAQALGDSAGVTLRDIDNYEMRMVYRHLGAYSYQEWGHSFHNHPEQVHYYIHKDVSNTMLVYQHDDDGKLSTYVAPTIALSRRGYDIFLGGRLSLCVIQGDSRNSRVLMIVGDSFQRAFAPWLIPCFEKIVVVSTDHYKEGRQGFLSLLADHKVTDFLVMGSGRPSSLSTLSHGLRRVALEVPLP